MEVMLAIEGEYESVLGADGLGRLKKLLKRSRRAGRPGGKARPRMNAGGSQFGRASPLATPFRENLIGIAAIAFANFVFLLNDTLVKVVGASLPLGEILFFRGLFASFGIAGIVLASGLHRQFGGLWRWSVFWRTFAEVVAAFLYLFALFHMPIANINAILAGGAADDHGGRRDLLRRACRLAALDGDRRSVSSAC